MIDFLTIAAILALVVAVLVAAPLFAQRRSAPGGHRADAQVFRDQLSEIERDKARGVISAAEADGARIEISRRLIQADKRGQASGDLRPGPTSLSRAIAVVAVLAVPGMAAGLYGLIGGEGQPDQPLASRAAPDRPSQEQAEALATTAPPAQSPDEDYRALVVQLEAATAQRPDDAQGQRLLGTALMRLGRFAEARQAIGRYIELSADVPPGAHAIHAEAMIMAAGGYVSPEAEAAIARALTADPELPMARYYGGLALRQAGRLEDAIAIWQRLLVDLPNETPWRRPLEQMLAETVAAQSAQSGPSRSEMEAAVQMTPEERAEMIEGMVAGLEARLTTEGGEVEEWAQLMNAYAQLGRTDDALRVYRLGRDAQQEATAKSFLRERAVVLGLPIE